jgi:hypothetical protein
MCSLPWPVRVGAFQGSTSMRRIPPPGSCKPISLASVTRLPHPQLAVCPGLLCELGQVVQPVRLRNARGINHVTEVVSRIS